MVWTFHEATREIVVMKNANGKLSGRRTFVLLRIVVTIRAFGL